MVPDRLSFCNLSSEAAASTTDERQRVEEEAVAERRRVGLTLASPRRARVPQREQQMRVRHRQESGSTPCLVQHSMSGPEVVAAVSSAPCQAWAAPPQNTAADPACPASDASPSIESCSIVSLHQTHDTSKIRCPKNTATVCLACAECFVKFDEIALGVTTEEIKEILHVQAKGFILCVLRRAL